MSEQRAAYAHVQLPGIDQLFKHSDPKITRHELKAWPEYFQLVASGIKKFEVRKNDRDFKVGDILILKEFDPETNEYTGDYVGREVLYILDKQPFVPDGYVIMSIDVA